MFTVNNFVPLRYRRLFLLAVMLHRIPLLRPIVINFTAMGLDNSVNYRNAVFGYVHKTEAAPEVDQ